MTQERMKNANMISLYHLKGWMKIAAALCARHIGGAVNFVAVSDFFQTPPDAVAAALAADNVVVALYFAFLFAISVPAKDDPIEIPIVKQFENPSVEVKEPSKCPMAPLLDLFEMESDNSILNAEIKERFQLVGDEVFFMINKQRD